MDQQLLELLACPRCRKSLILKQENGNDVGLVCPICCLIFPIKDDIPIMLMEEAKGISKEEIACASS